MKYNPEKFHRRSIRLKGYDYSQAGTRPAPTLDDVVGAFKSITMHQYTDGVRRKDWPPFYGKLWQRNYYEHIIRSEEEMNRICKYIIENPGKGAEDEDNPGNIICKDTPAGERTRDRDWGCLCCKLKSDLGFE